MPENQKTWQPAPIGSNFDIGEKYGDFTAS